MKTRELRGISKEELKAKVLELRKELVKHNAQIAIGTIPKSPGKVKQIKKTIARMLTLMEVKK